MNKALSFVRLDFLTVKSYLKNSLILFAVVALIVILSTGVSTIVVSVVMVFAALLAAYPFAIGEKNNIDALYPTLSINRRTVVLGRYLFALIVDICSGLFACLFAFAALTVMQKDFNAWESLAAILIIFLVYSGLQAVQLPIFFKLGYMKAKILAYLPFFGLFLLVFVFFNFLENSIKQVSVLFEWFAANPIVTVIFVMVVWLGIMLLSYKASLSFYSKRDF
ncbi:MAG: ABC-2 transporter permease [Methanimicrococcus sp.]|nr:ABC-2 transporter permease [Methanimicrococcus sp.]